MNPEVLHCDIFCRVVDNYGDIGVCWRLARQLAHEQGAEVRLWVDDLCSLARLCHEVDAKLAIQHSCGVEVRLWEESFPEVQPYPIVIETFACRLPEPYLAAIAAQAQPPVWINLEYLSAEEWVESHHQLPSPHPNLPLTKYYFFPGFTRQTGGLLLERDLLARRDAFQGDPIQQQAFWHSLGLAMPAAETLKISLFAYENAALPSLFDAWSSGAQPVLCLVPEGRILPRAAQYFEDTAPHPGKDYRRGNLHVQVLPFVEQERYDLLLWACDINFVRGEDSLVRAIWAGRPFIWQIYPQHDAVHLKKLQAFLILHNSLLSQSASHAMESFWQEWNIGSEAGQQWPFFLAACGELNRHARNFSQQLSQNNLALNLLDFCAEIGRMRALKIALKSEG